MLIKMEWSRGANAALKSSLDDEFKRSKPKFALIPWFPSNVQEKFNKIGFCLNKFRKLSAKFTKFTSKFTKVNS